MRRSSTNEIKLGLVLEATAGALRAAGIKSGLAVDRDLEQRRKRREVRKGG
jgi:hypothetical protein